VLPGVNVNLKRYDAKPIMSSVSNIAALIASTSVLSTTMDGSKEACNRNGRGSEVAEYEKARKHVTGTVEDVRRQSVREGCTY
jgi:hypothetical protein